MPDLDVSDILSDPDLADVFIVRRRADTVGSNGRSSVSSVDYQNVIGVVLHTKPDDNVRKEEGQMTSRVINVVTRFRLRAAAAGVQPDIIILAGVEYTVKSILPHTRYGAGFVKATAESMNASDAPPV